MHIYDDVSHQGGYTYKPSNKTEAVTSFNEWQKYMTLSGQQGGPSEYQEPQLCSYKDTREAVDTCNNGSSDFYGQKDDLKKMKRCLCVLSFLVVILFLITVSSLGLAAYGFASITTPSSQIQEASSEGIVDTTEFIHNHNFTLFKEQLTQELVTLRSVVNMIESHINATSRDIASLVSLASIVNNLESQVNTINSEVVSQRTFTNNLESRLNGTNSQVSTLRSSVTTSQSQLRMTNTTVSYLQLAIRSQPSMQYMYQLADSNLANAISVLVHTI